MNESINVHLKKKIVPFWNRQVDPVFGGYYGYAEQNLIPNKLADKGAIKIARILWAYAALYRHYQEDTYREHAKIAYDYLVNHLYDKTWKGVFWKSAYSGQIINDTKHIYAQSFAIYGLSEYFLATGDPEARDLALEIFWVVETKAYQPEKQAYGEQFTRDWRQMDNRLLANNTALPAYTTNSLIHLIEAYTALFLAAGDEQVRQCLQRLLHLFHNKAYNRDENHCYIEFDGNWGPIDNGVSFGHDIEASWLIDRAMAAIDHHPAELMGMTRAIAENTWRRGYDNGVIASGDAANSPLVWWIQAEAVVGFLNHFLKTHDPDYLVAARQTLAVIMTKIVDHREGGEWYWSVDRSGKPLEDFGISENWKANYHNVRMCLEILQRGDML